MRLPRSLDLRLSETIVNPAEITARPRKARMSSAANVGETPGLLLLQPATSARTARSLPSLSYASIVTVARL